MNQNKLANKEIDNFAIRVFRDVADNDYIAARLCYRAGLIPQFHWQALQCIEKYFKAIFLFNRIDASKIEHSIESAISLSNNLPFEMKFSKVSHKFLQHISRYGNDRYFEFPYHIYGPKLAQLDYTVWEIRHYCFQLNYSIFFNGDYLSMFDTYITEIEKSLKNFKESKQIPFLKGRLENIVEKKEHVSRKSLIWQNAFFSKQNRNFVHQPMHSGAENSPLSLNPSLLHEISKYIRFSREAKSKFEELIKNSSSAN